MKMQNMKRGETTEQIMLFQWAERVKGIIPAIALMYHVPNEGKRTNGAILKAAGLKKGVPDVCLPVPSGGFHALYIELKYGKNVPTDEQEEYMELLRQQGNKTEVCYSARDAQEKILEYLDLGRRRMLPLRQCLNAPWIAGKCDGVQLPGKMFSRPECQKCERHTPTKAEKIIAENMATVNKKFSWEIIQRIIYLSTGETWVCDTMENALETINKDLAILVKNRELDVEQSAAVLSVAMDAYYAGKGGKGNE